jgi:hypothetical protein
MRVAKGLVFVALVMVWAAVASAQVSAPQIPPPDEPAIYIASAFVRDDGPVKVVKDIAIDVAGVSVVAAAGRMRGDSQITLENATITISPTVATHVRRRMTYSGDQIRDLPPTR